MEKRKTFHGRQVGKKRLLPIVFPLFLFLLIPLNGYGDDTPMPEVVQQNSTRITGVVKDAYGEPVIGANVKVVGTTQGTITDFEGKFSINVSGASAKIKISFIGYKDKEVTAKKGVSLNIVLEEDAQTLGEVQVVAYGVQKKVSITGAISSMKGDDLLKTPAGSLSNVLSGQITGISSVQYSGEPGADRTDYTDNYKSRDGSDRGRPGHDRRCRPNAGPDRHGLRVRGLGEPVRHGADVPAESPVRVAQAPAGGRGGRGDRPAHDHDGPAVHPGAVGADRPEGVLRGPGLLSGKDPVRTAL